MKKRKKTTLAVSAIATVDAVDAAVYLFICQCRKEDYIVRESDN